MTPRRKKPVARPRAKAPPPKQSPLPPPPPQLPYSAIVGQEDVKLALELCFVEPRIGGVLLRGERGTGKTTAVRAFARMALDRPLVNLPINATEDRVVGGWSVESLFEEDPDPTFKEGLLQEADKGLLYVDEVNLLDDHIVNIILDVTSTGVLPVQRDMIDRTCYPRFVLVGTMNPEEGELRPQLLDRFGLMVNVRAEEETATRVRILKQVLAMEDPAQRTELEKEDTVRRAQLHAARKRLVGVELPDERARECISLAKVLEVEGHRGELVMARAARACAALNGRKQVLVEDIRRVAPLALTHRRKPGTQRESAPWDTVDDALVDKTLGSAS